MATPVVVDDDVRDGAWDKKCENNFALRNTTALKLQQDFDAFLGQKEFVGICKIATSR